MQALRRILGIEWYDKVSNVAIGLQEIRSYLIYRFSLLTDVIRYLVTFVVYLRTHLPRRHCNCQVMPTLTLLLLQTRNDHWVVQGERIAATSRRGLRDICWSRSNHKPRSLVVENVTTLSLSSAAVSVAYRLSIKTTVVIRSITFVNVIIVVVVVVVIVIVIIIVIIIIIIIIIIYLLINPVTMNDD